MAVKGCKLFRTVVANRTHSDLHGYMMAVDDAKVEQEILQQVRCARSVAPRDIALAIAPDGKDWRSFLTQIKRVSCRLTEEGKLVLIRKRKSIAPSALKGVYRLASPENFVAEYSEPNQAKQV